ncbi:MAG TPA: SDR family oxidoreductase [Gemmataceae bacterium]|nr:SDR family oxidoreductase [Gemmataceae bacterium]
MDKLIIGCGYLGRRIASRWCREGHHVFATTRTGQHANELRQLGLEPVICDVLNPDTLATLPAVQTVVHCVGLDRRSGQTMRAVYVQGLANVLARLPTTNRFLYISSTSVYGQRAGELVDETAVTEPSEESGRIVLEAEELARKQWPGAIILRFAGIYGPGRLLRQEAVQAGEPIVAEPERWLNLIHVDDGATAVLAAESRSQPGAIYNVSDDHPIPRREFYAALASILGAPAPRFAPPDPCGPLPPHERANRRISNELMRRELGVNLQYPSFREGLRASV